MNVTSLPNIVEGRERQLERLRTRLKGELDAACGMLTSELELVSLPQLATIIQTLRQISERVETMDMTSHQALAGIEEIVMEIHGFAAQLDACSGINGGYEDIVTVNETFLRR